MKSNQLNTYQLILAFKKRGKLEYLEKNLSCCRVEKQQSQATYDAGSENRTRATLMHGTEASALTIAPYLDFETLGDISIWRTMISWNHSLMKLFKMKNVIVDVIIYRPPSQNIFARNIV